MYEQRGNCVGWQAGCVMVERACVNVCSSVGRRHACAQEHFGYEKESVTERDVVWGLELLHEKHVK